LTDKVERLGELTCVINRQASAPNCLASASPAPLFGNDPLTVISVDVAVAKINVMGDERMDLCPACVAGITGRAHEVLLMLRIVEHKG